MQLIGIGASLYSRSVERHVKERLIGAAVLMAAAVILIPEMLSGPDRSAPASTQQVAEEGPLKTYTIDLQQPRANPKATPTIDETVDPMIEDRAPPPETGQAPAAASLPEKPSSEVRPNAEPIAPPSPPEQAPPASQERAPARTADVQPAAGQSTQPPVQPPSKAGEGRWAVQLGSFSKRATADRLVNELRSQGHDAFVMPVRSGSATLYRVRVGPMPNRAAAEAALRTLKTRASGAAIVAHP